MKLKKIFFDGIFANNPVLVQLVGMCSVISRNNKCYKRNRNGFFSNIRSNMFKYCNFKLKESLFQYKVRIPAYVVIIATFVTLVQMS